MNTRNGNQAAEKSLITREAILNELECEYEKLRAFLGARTQSNGNGGSSKNTQQLIEGIKDGFRTVIESNGDIVNPKAIAALCRKLSEVQESLRSEEGIDGKIFQLIEKMRIRAKKRLAVAAGWEKDVILKDGRLTEFGIETLNKAREALGLGTVIKLDDETYLTPEKIRSFAFLANELDEVALAEFVAIILPERFAFNNRTIQNLRPYLGEFEAHGGGGFEDIPVKLLTLPECKHLRELLFNRYRDKYYPMYRDHGAQSVVVDLNKSRKSSEDEPVRVAFIDSLIDYFKNLDNIGNFERLRTGFGAETRFPAPHQLISVAEIERLKQILIADEMGGGKTGSAIAGFEHLREQGKAKRCLVICPSEIVNEWVKRLGANGQGYFKEEHVPSVAVIRTGDPDRTKTWEKAGNADYVIMSIDMARKLTGRKLHTEYAREIGADYFVVDEAHNVKNPKGSDTEMVYKISQCDSIQNGYTVLLSGTPVPNKIKDIAAHIRLLHGGRERPDIREISKVDFSNLTTLSRAISRNNTRLVRNLLLLRMLKRPTQDCLPVGTELNIETPRESRLNPIEKAVYDAIYEDPFYTATEKILMMRRICLHDNRENPKFRAEGTGASKYREILSSIDEFLNELKVSPQAHSGKLIVANSGYSRGVTTDFDKNNHPDTSNLESYIAGRLKLHYEKQGVAVFVLDGCNTKSNLMHDKDGGLRYDHDGAPMTKTRSLIAQFRNHPGPAILVTKTEIIGEGLDFSFAARGILLAPTYTLDERDQFARRLYRKGQKHNVRFRTLQTAQTIEQGMAEYALRKQALIRDLLAGRPLTEAEQELINEDSKKINRGGFLAYETMTPKQKVMWFLNRFNQLDGKDKIREFIELEGGRYGREFAELYYRDWETSYSGNNARLVTALIEKELPGLEKTFGNELNAADIACGGLTMARMLEPHQSVTVWGSDINQAMLEIGKKLVTKQLKEGQAVETTMDELPYEDESMHLAVHSLALQYAYHNSHKNAGRERIQALSEMNRVLKPGGMAVISLPPHIFENEGKFDRIAAVLQEKFGFELLKEKSGFAMSCDREDEEPFEVYIFTLRKVGPPSLENLDDNFWKDLDFKVRKTANDSKGEPRQPREKKEPPPGAFHENFFIGDQQVRFSDHGEQKEAKEKFDTDKTQYQSILDKIQELVTEHGSFSDIPQEKLLSIPFVGIVSHEKQKIRDLYFRALIKNYRGRIADIPIEQIAAESPVILVRGHTKKKGAFLCLAKMDQKTQKLGTYGKRYFYEAEFEVPKGKN